MLQWLREPDRDWDQRYEAFTRQLGSTGTAEDQPTTLPVTRERHGDAIGRVVMEEPSAVVVRGVIDDHDLEIAKRSVLAERTVLNERLHRAAERVALVPAAEED